MLEKWIKIDLICQPKSDSSNTTNTENIENQEIKENKVRGGGSNDDFVFILAPHVCFWRCETQFGCDALRDWHQISVFTGVYIIERLLILTMAKKKK